MTFKLPPDYRKAVERVLEDEFNVTEYHFLPPGAYFKKHPCVEFILEGKTLHHMLPGSPSDRRGVKANKMWLRRLCRQHSAPTALLSILIQPTERLKPC